MNSVNKRQNRPHVTHKVKKTREERRAIRWGGWKTWTASLVIFCLTSVYLEVVLHICVFGNLSLQIVYPMLFGCIFGCVLLAIAGLFPAIVRNSMLLIATLAETVLAEVQLVYHAIFGSLMAMNQVSMGGDVVTNFGKQILYGIGQNILPVLSLLIPFILILVFLILRRLPRGPIVLAQRCASFLVVGLLCLWVASILAAGKDEAFSVYTILNNVNTSTETSYKNVGMLATTEREIQYMLVRSDDVVNPLNEQTLGITDTPKTYSSRNYNVLDIDFTQLSENTTDETLKSLDEYFALAVPTTKNDYTALLEGYNLITICAESFCPYFISEELTPALYKLSNTGIIFENYYGTYQSVTTNGEYTFCMGLYPDLTRTKTQSSFDVAGSNYLPFCLGNALAEKDYSCWAYHNYIGEFYNRNITHPNMGYIFQSADDGLDITIDWPSSDLDMMMESVDDYIESGKNFHAYYMTFSGHYQYNWENAMSAKNRDVVDSMDYSENVKAYIACNLELEYALEYLLERLEEAGVADQTCIVLTNDHYPYGLTEEEYNELAGEELDTTFEKYRNSFICYVPNLKENIYVEEYCSTADILPTLLNLFGVEYDSRLLAGTDVLSNGIHVAVLSDQSFLTADFRYDAETENVTVHDGSTAPTDEILSKYKAYVANKFAISTNILNSDYYAHAFKESASDSELEDTVVFTDIKNIFNQAAVLYMYRNGYVSPETEDTFGGSKAARIGEFVDVMYRISGSPEVDSSMLPSDYAGSNFDEEYEYYDAICWAFEVGILRKDDASIKWSRNVYYKTAVVMISRFAEYCGVDISVEDDAVSEWMEEYPRLSEEEVRSMLWCDSTGITTRDSTLEELFGNASEHLSRYQMTSFLFYLCTYELNTDG